eukprot:71343-Alexandrium_andersonii.AAC.1
MICGAWHHLCSADTNVATSTRVSVRYATAPSSDRYKLCSSGPHSSSGFSLESSACEMVRKAFAYSHWSSATSL